MIIKEEVVFTLPTTVDTTDVVLLSSFSGSLVDTVSPIPSTFLFDPPLPFFFISSSLGILILGWSYHGSDLNLISTTKDFGHTTKQVMIWYETKSKKG